MVIAALYFSSNSVSARTGGGVAKQKSDGRGLEEGGELKIGKMCGHPLWMTFYLLIKLLVDQ